MPLKVAIIGAGIGGLSAAVALRRAGHHVTVFDKSGFATEVGAALAISPNGLHVLKHLGFSTLHARASSKPSWDSVDGLSLRLLASVDMSNARERYGDDLIVVHRMDFHKELLRLALESEGDTEDVAPTGTKSTPVVLRLSAEVKCVDIENGTLSFADGSKVMADLIVGADGLHSVTRQAVLGSTVYKPARTESSAFRMLIPTARVAEEDGLEQLMQWKSTGVSIIADTSSKDRERHIAWYSCRDGEIQNLVGIHPTRTKDDSDVDYKTALLDEFKHFDRDVVNLLSLAEEVKCWPLLYYEPFPKWTSGKLVLIGDAAHPMLPFGGQAANQALEDSGALGALFHDSNITTNEIPARLKLFEKVRRNRASTIQMLSSTRVGQEPTVEAILWNYAEPGAAEVPNTFQKRIDHAFGYNVFAACQSALKDWNPE